VREQQTQSTELVQPALVVEAAARGPLVALAVLVVLAVEVLGLHQGLLRLVPQILAAVAAVLVLALLLLAVLASSLSLTRLVKD
jgi:hypothetical protein